MVQRAQWTEPAERIDRALAALGLARSRTHAAELIAEHSVRLSNRLAKKPAQLVQPGDKLTVLVDAPYVSRAAQKLVAALDAFDVPVTDCFALDLGASTGGFTEVLLRRGARGVIALDVGHSQLAPPIRSDRRVHTVEGCNARYMSRAELALLTDRDDDIDVIVGDLSFISLRLIFPAIARVAADHTRAVLLIKPQFEVGRELVSGGIVRDPTAHAAAIHGVFQAAREAGFVARGVIASPVAGQHGNREYLADFVRAAQPSAGAPTPNAGAAQPNAGAAQPNAGAAQPDQTEWDAMITRATKLPDGGGV